MHFLLCRVYKLRLLVVAHVVVADVAALIHYDPYFETLLRGILGVQVVTDTYRTFLKEVHLRHFIFFVVYYATTGLRQELARFQVEGDVVKELGVGVLAGFEEVLELVEHVVEQKLYHHVLFYQ